jgi:hypothetical protein
MLVPVMALNSSPAMWLEVPGSLHRQCRRGLAKTFLLTDLFNHIPRDVRCLATLPLAWPCPLDPC